MKLNELIKHKIRLHEIPLRKQIYFFKGIHSNREDKNPYFLADKQRNGRATWSRYYAKLWNLGREVAEKYNYFEMKKLF